MIRLELRSDELPNAAACEQLLKGTPPDAVHFDQVITDDATVLVDGEVVAVCQRWEQAWLRNTMPLTVDAIWSACEGIGHINDYRTDGMKTRSRMLGHHPRIPLRRDWCAPCSAKNDHPAEHGVLEQLGEHVTRLYRRWSPGHYERNVALAGQVLPEWRMSSTFTSAILNRDSPLIYHRDRGNFDGTWNMMFAAGRDLVGGLFVVPRWRLAFCVEPAVVVGFDAQAVLHGVTPIRHGHRYSVVYYALRNMRKCGTRDAELARIRTVKTERERRRVGPGDQGAGGDS